MKLYTILTSAGLLLVAACSGNRTANTAAGDNLSADTVLNEEGVGADNLSAVDGPALNETVDANAADAPLNGEASLNATTANGL